MRSEKLKVGISLILPVYNEEQIVEQALKKCLVALEEGFEDYEVIVVDDASKDRSLEIIRRVAAENDRVKILENLINLNQGISMQRGFSVATKEIVMHNGVDLPFDPSMTKKVIQENWKDVDVLVLERKAYSGATWRRKIISKCNLILRTMLFPVIFRGFKDLNYIQFYSRAALKEIMPLASSPTFTTAEMIYRAKHLNYRVTKKCFEYEARPVGKGSLGKVHDITWSIYDMLRFRYLVTIGLEKNGKLK